MSSDRSVESPVSRDGSVRAGEPARPNFWWVLAGMIGGVLAGAAGSVAVLAALALTDSDLGITMPLGPLGVPFTAIMCGALLGALDGLLLAYLLPSGTSVRRARVVAPWLTVVVAYVLCVATAVFMGLASVPAAMAVSIVPALVGMATAYWSAGRTPNLPPIFES